MDSKSIYSSTTIYHCNQYISDIISVRGNLYFIVADTGLCKLNIFTMDELQVLLKEYSYRGLSWDKNNTLYICDRDHHITMYDVINGEVTELRFKNSGSLAPGKITLHTSGDVFLCQHNEILRMRMRDKLIRFEAGGTDNHFMDGKAKSAPIRPSCILTSLDGNVYFGDSKFHVIRMLKDGYVSTIAGTPGSSGHQDGGLKEANFASPSDMVFDKDGSILVADKNGIRRVDLNKKIVSTEYRHVYQQWSDTITSLALADSGIILVAISSGEIIALNQFWRWERFLWIGLLKEEDCPLACLPKEIILEIAKFLRFSRRTK